MVAPVLTGGNGPSALDKLLEPERLTSGAEPERRVVFCGISWDRYLSFDRQLGDDRPGPRLYYLEGELEFMTTSNEHERVKKWIGGFVEDYLLNAGIDTVPRGQATMRLALKEAGAEPDESWCLRKEKHFPDLVLEVALTTGGVDKLEIYRRFRVREVWIWRGNKLRIFTLGTSGDYETSRTSRLLPGLDVALLERCVAIGSWQQARRTFRSALAVASPFKASRRR